MKHHPYCGMPCASKFDFSRTLLNVNEWRGKKTVEQRKEWGQRGNRTPFDGSGGQSTGVDETKGEFHGHSYPHGFG